MADNFRDTDDGEVLGIDDGVATGSPHAVSADAEEFEPTLRVRRFLSASSTQGRNKLRPIHFTGCFAGGDQDSHGAIVRDEVGSESAANGGPQLES